MPDEVLPIVQQVIELAKALAEKHPAGAFPLPAELANPQDVIVTWVHAMCRKEPRRRGRVPTVRLGCRIDKPTGAAEGQITSDPVAVLGSLILWPGATREQLAASQRYVMNAIRPGSREEGRAQAAYRRSVQRWLSRAWQLQHGYTVRPEGGGYRYRHAPPSAP
ncbi:MAG: hypothetical protein FJX75_22210 [Armatimonadetes bacterium]|nr:hypothetical protein [Armatimonadota bacterium]